jgi:threonine aldolase
LVSLENTSNRGGGSCYEMEDIINIRQACDDNNIKLHLDGARLFNALVAKKQSPAQFGKTFHSISICLSKSLGCPVGSLLLGNKEFISKARRYRKVFGGGMRQAGYLAAAGIYALDHNIDRLSEDHLHASQIAAALAQKDFVQEVYPVETNIIIFSLKQTISAKELVARFKDSQILVHAISSSQVRIVTHLDITPEMTEKTIRFIQSI